jgi:hypothetical protein
MGDDGCAWFGYNSLHTAQVVNFDIDSNLSFLFGVHTNRGRGVGWILTERGRVKWELMGQKQKRLRLDWMGEHSTINKGWRT